VKSSNSGRTPAISSRVTPGITLQNPAAIPDLTKYY
jgi:hypothetical protein